MGRGENGPLSSDTDDGFDKRLNEEDLLGDERESFDPRLDWVDITEEGSGARTHQMTIATQDGETYTSGLKVNKSLETGKFEIIIEDRPKGEGTEEQSETVCSDATAEEAYEHMKKDGFNSWPPIE